MSLDCDGRGNVAAVTDSNQILRAFYAWDAYGSKNVAATSAQYTQQNQPYQFSTKWKHANSGLVHFGARFYDPQLGRFINRDPIGAS